MAYIEIEGGRSMNGEVCIQGSKNAALPILAGSILHGGTTVLHRCPRITDVFHMVRILEELGCHTSWEGSTLTVEAADASGTVIPAEPAGRMRCSITLLGALLGRFGKAQVPYPGGCTIGERPIDLHLEALERMGAVLEPGDDILDCSCGRLAGEQISLRFPSVGATENILLAAVLARGTTVLTGAAKEPEITELARFLNSCGARISGAGTDRIVIEGVERLTDSEFTLAADRIVAGTYLLAVAAAGGRAMLKGAPAGQMKCVMQTAEQMGVSVMERADGILAEADGRIRPLKQLATAPYPGFPTDLQSPAMATLCLADGESCIRERIFEARFGTAAELKRMGARIEIRGRQAFITGVRELHGAEVCAPELRGGAALTVAAAAAKGRTVIRDCHFIERGYEDICRDMESLGVRARRHPERYGAI